MRRVALPVIAFAALALIGLLIPFPYQVCPSWDVLVVDTAGNPVPDITIRLSYQDYSVERTSHEEDRTADSQGRASFPARVSSRSFARRGLGALAAALTGGVHASFGLHASAFAFGQGLQGSAVSNGYVTDWTGKPNHMASKITVARSQ